MTSARFTSGTCSRRSASAGSSCRHRSSRRPTVPDFVSNEEIVIAARKRLDAGRLGLPGRRLRVRDDDAAQPPGLRPLALPAAHPASTSRRSTRRRRFLGHKLRIPVHAGAHRLAAGVHARRRRRGGAGGGGVRHRSTSSAPRRSRRWRRSPRLSDARRSSSSTSAATTTGSRRHPRARRGGRLHRRWR